MNRNYDLLLRGDVVKQMTAKALDAPQSHTRAYARCISAVETMPKANLWISTGRGLPYDASVCLVWNGNQYNVATYWGNGEWIINGEAATDVTHWMLLPE